MKIKKMEHINNTKTGAIFCALPDDVKQVSVCKSIFNSFEFVPYYHSAEKNLSGTELDFVRMGLADFRQQTTNFSQQVLSPEQAKALGYIL